MRQWLCVLMLWTAGCATQESRPPDLTPQHACWVQVPNPLDHGLVLDTTDSFLLAVESDRDVELTMRFMVVGANEVVISDETRAVQVYRAIPAEVRLPVCRVYAVPPRSQARLSLRLRALGQSVQATVRLRVSCLGLTITDPTRRRQEPAEPPVQPVTERVY